MTAFQLQVAQLFFGLLASDGFLLAGGGALLAHGLTARRTQDRDFSTRPGAGDLNLDSAPGRPAMASIAGPTFAPAELAGRKLIALFDRAAARDFVDVFTLSRFSKAELLELAREIDAGFDVGVFVEMIGLLSRYSDVDLDLGDVNAAEVRRFFADWSAELKPGR